MLSKGDVRIIGVMRKCAARLGCRLRSLSADQDGAMSVVSVFAVLLLTILLGMVMNVGRVVDHKIRLQNAADAVTYSGGVVIARGMNALAFTNHLLCDVFALTAYMREARDRHAESYVPAILDAWNQEAPVFAQSNFEKFIPLASAIPAKTPLEQALVDGFCSWAAAASPVILPTLEFILQEELIPEYQRAVVAAFPDIAQQAAMEVARRNGRPDFGRGEMLGVLWRTNVVPVGGPGELVQRTLPVVDPVMDQFPNQADYFNTAVEQRRNLSHHYLRLWNNRSLIFFDREAKMSQFASLWRSFTCGQLEQLLSEYPASNLPFVIQTPGDEVVDPNSHLDQYFTFVGVAYWRPMRATLPGLFQHPMGSDTIAYAQVRVFIPRARLIWHYYVDTPENILGGIPGDFAELPPDDAEQSEPAQGEWRVVREDVPTHWDLLNQNWTCALQPATVWSLPLIVQTKPPLPEFAGWNVQLPSLPGWTTADIQYVSPH